MNSKSPYFSPNTKLTPAKTWLWKCSTCFPRKENVFRPASVRRMSNPNTICSTIPHITGLQFILQNEDDSDMNDYKLNEVMS